MVKHTFVSGTKDKTLPKEVLTTLPEDLIDVPDQTNVCPTPVTNNEIQVTDGVWKFDGWDEQEVFVDEDEITFTGTWAFTSTKQPSSVNNNTKTGDSNNIMGYVTVMLASITVLVGALYVSKKKTKL
ncbi:MAG: SHIRT domain-containing protein [Coprobacillaceae bacterium]